MSPENFPRRTVLAAGGLGALGSALPAQLGHAAPAPRPGNGNRPRLRFGDDGRFKIIQFNDTQDDELTDRRTPADAARGRARHGIVGERNEDECPGPFNSGMFNAILDRGDVRGVFVGHDHVNSYVGNYYGVQLGYAPGTGFGAYGLDGAERNRLRGCRVFELTEAGGDVSIDTRLVFASDFGIDLTANDQPMQPTPLAPAQQNA